MRSGRLLFLIGLLVLAGAPQVFSSDTGILLLAQDGDRAWSAEIKKIGKTFKGKAPFEFLIGPVDSKVLNKSLERLERSRVRRILAIPLYLDSEDPELSHARYALGLSENPSPSTMRDIRKAKKKGRRHRHDLSRSKTKLPVSMTKALGTDSLLVSIVADRFNAAARNPERDGIVLIGHGRDHEADNRRRGAILQQIAEKAQEGSRAQAVQSATLRLDGKNEDLRKDLASLRTLARKVSKDRRVIFVPFELGQSRLRRAVEKGLEGVFYRFVDKPLAPHGNLVKWVQRNFDEGRGLTNQRWYTKPFRPKGKKRGKL